jgi:hemerythrin HHE cation binding domain-containing protein
VSLCPPLRSLSADHARWLAALARPTGADGGGARLVALWDAEIQPHCRAEEEVLLPELGRRLSEADAVIVFTLGDHLVLRRLVRDLRSATGPAAALAATALAARLAEHFHFEERTLLPALQETLGCDFLCELQGELNEAGSSQTPRPADRPPVTHVASRTKGTKP